MKKLGNHNRHRQWTQHEKEEEPEVKLAKQSVVEARRVFHGSVKVSHSLRQRAYSATHGEFKPVTRRGKVVILSACLILLLLVPFWGYWKQSGLGAGVPILDPLQTLWEENWASNSLAGWNSRNMVFDSFAPKGMTMQSNTTHSAIALSKQPIDFSTAVSKTLKFDMRYEFRNSTSGCCSSRWGWYLTSNQTLPGEAGYFPYEDESVALFAMTTPTAGATERTDIFIQRNPNDPVQSGDYGSCQTGGTCFLSGNGALTLTLFYDHNLDLALNFTSNPNSPTFQSFDLHGSTPTSSSTGFLPWFQIQGQPYYFGLWKEEKGATDYATIHWMIFSGDSWLISLQTPGTAGSAAPPEIVEPGGFFGWIGRLLITVAVWALEYIAGFLGWLADVFITAMNAVGGFFGLGAIGTAIRDALTGTANFIVNVFAVTVGWAVTLASLFQNGIGFVTNFFSGSNGFVAWLVSFFSTLPGIWTVIQNLWNSLNLAVLSMNQILMVYYLIGEFQVYKNGWAGFRDWTEMGAMFTVKIVQVGFKIGKEMFQIILDVKRLLVSWL